MIENEETERERRKRNYGCEFRTRHKISQLQIVFYCTITHEPCENQPSKCKIRKKTLALEKHRPITSFFNM